MKNFVFLFLALCCLGTALRAQLSLELSPANLTVPNGELTGFHRYQLVTLDVPSLLAQRSETVKFALQTTTGILAFDLARWDIRKPGHQTFTTAASGRKQELPRELSAQFRGQVAGGGTAVFTIDEEFVLGSWTANGTTTNLEPLWRLYPAAPRNVYLLYRNTDVKDLPGACGTAAGFHQPDVFTPERNKLAGECFEVEIALAADFEMFQNFGNAASVENFMLGTLANVQTNYDDEFPDALEFVVAATYIATSNATDPWTNDTDPEVLLPEFRTWGNNGNFGASFDVASLWSGRNFNGTTVGLAYLDAVCASIRYNVLENFTTNATSMRVMWAHELGHNFGSSHDPANGPTWIMSPTVSAATQWSGASITSITNFYTGVNCLATCPAPEPPAAAGLALVSGVCAGSLVPFFSTSTGSVRNVLWSFPGGNPSSSADFAPVVMYDSPGNYTATLTVSNQFGSNSTQIPVTVVAAGNNGTNVLFFENFEQGLGQMTVINPGGPNTWGIGEVSGNLGGFAAGIDNYSNDAAGQSDKLETPSLDLTLLSTPRVEVEYAYNRYNSSFNDRLRVLIRVDGGPTQVLFTGLENGSGNFATGPDNTDIFVPLLDSDWCQLSPGCISLDLSTYANETDVKIQVENISGYGNFMWVDNIRVEGACANILPVEWLSFEAAAAGKTALLDWTVNQDEAHAGFAVERSTATTPWLELGWVPAANNATQSVAYQFTDGSVLSGETYYYRLRQRDLDGRESLSDVRTVAFENVEALTVWPNPTSGLLTVQSPEENATFSLLNGLGHVLRSGTLQNGRTDLDMAALPAAVYLLRVGDGELVRVVKR